MSANIVVKPNATGNTARTGTDWIDRYVNEVGRRLPPKQRVDVQQEIRSLIEDEVAGRLQAAFADSQVAAVFGSYDETPPGGWFSRYRNLMHRYYHQTARRTARTFWAGCGAVRADLFRRIGGFDTVNLAGKLDGYGL